MFAGPIARSTIRTSLVFGLRLGVQAGTLLLITRLLGPNQFGAFAGVASLAVMLGTLATFGTHLVLLKEMSIEPARRESVLLYAIPSTLLCGSIILIFYLLLCTMALHKTGIPIAVLLAIGMAEILLNPLFGLKATEHMALGRTAQSQLLTTLPLALRLIAAATVFLVKPVDPLAVFAYGYFTASLIALGIANTTVTAPWPSPKKWKLPNKKQQREAVGYAALSITATAPAELDKALATKLLSLTASGVYAASARVIGALTLPVIAMMLAALPRLFRENQRQSKNNARLFQWIFFITLVYSTLLAVILWFISPVFIKLFGDKYEGIQTMIRWLCLAVPGMALRIAVGSILIVLGSPWMRAGFEIVGLGLMAIGSVILTTYLGPIGMPLALAFSEWGGAVLGIVFVIIKIQKNTLL